MQSDEIHSSRALARGLLQIRAVQLDTRNPFTWSSGWKSPIYCDNRLILSYPVLRQQVIDGFEAWVRSNAPGTEVVAGAATGGIAHAAWLSERLQLPMVYVRSSAKAHGRGRQVEGRLPSGARTLVIEDTLSTGRSAYQVVDALRQEGAQVLAVLAIFSYGFPQTGERVRESGVPAHALLDYDTLIEVARTEAYIDSEGVEVLRSWRKSPETFGQE
ncbi:orotate phosphoribosyltransferase [Alicyclobacillus shizuokensis]|uniref:orotate phosphoribosyltransferase n=1 Tax=Alicyclobacillus shizuokensis TaxID=392014 RepID=UPI000835A23E|nr:orotate phosphoribosyltransferase [Alicyclobacillus shizuokensis]MCL6626938.1 orotate phosphoribosyltransferase [Alicyclobacillus shizuokensis]